MDKVEFLILRNFLHNEQYTRKVIPFVKSEYFEDANQKIVFEEIIAVPIFDDQGEVSFVVEELNDITELIQSKEIIEHLKIEINTLRGIIPICSSCKNIRDDKGYWQQVEVYIRDRSEAQFSHGLCPECMEKLYPEFARKAEGKG